MINELFSLKKGILVKSSHNKTSITFAHSWGHTFPHYISTARWEHLHKNNNEWKSIFELLFAGVADSHCLRAGLISASTLTFVFLPSIRTLLGYIWIVYALIVDNFWTILWLQQFNHCLCWVFVAIYLFPNVDILCNWKTFTIDEVSVNHYRMAVLYKSKCTVADWWFLQSAW